MKLNSIASAVASALLCLTVVGCAKGSGKAASGTDVDAAKAGGATEPTKQASPDPEKVARIVMLDPAVKRSVTCTGLQERVLTDGRLEVTANLRNQENRRIEVQAGCVFKNEAGFAVDDESRFRTVILTENAQESVRFVSLNDQARTYTIRVRQAR